MASFIKKYWFVFLLLVGITGIYSWYDPNYCYEEGKKYTDADFKDGPSNSEVVSNLAYIYDLKRPSGSGEFDENATKQLEEEVDEFYNKYPNYKRGGVDQKAEPEFYAFRSFQYFFPSEKLDRINDHLKKDGWGNRLMKRVVGYQYIQYYGPCGHISFGIADELYEDDKIDLDNNPYKAKINK